MTGLYLATPPPPLPHAAADTLFPRVLLAIDFSSASLGAARWATTHVASRGEAVLMHVVPSDAEPSSLDGLSDADDESLRMYPEIRRRPPWKRRGLTVEVLLIVAAKI